MCSQPSTRVSAVASGLRQYSRKTWGPRTRISPSSSAIRISTPGSGRPDGAELEVLQGAHGADGGGLGHAPALEHRHAAGVEELEDLGRDRRGAGDGLVDVAAEQAADPGVQALLGLLEGVLHLVGDLLAAVAAPADLDAELDRLGEALAILV